MGTTRILGKGMNSTYFRSGLVRMRPTIKTITPSNEELDARNRPPLTKSSHSVVAVSKHLRHNKRWAVAH